MPTIEETLSSYEGQEKFGGPHSVTVYSDTGQPGDRGTLFLLSNGDPNLSTTIITYSFLSPSGSLVPIPATVQKNDVCINLNPADSGYLDLYQYREPNPNVPSETQTKWYRELELTPLSFPYNASVTFTSGSGILSMTAPVPEPYWTQIATVIASGSAPALTALKLNLLSNTINIQYNIIGENPISSNILTYPPTPPQDSISFNTTNKTITLNYVISGLEYISSTWIPLNGSKSVHIIITLDGVV